MSEFELNFPIPESRLNPNQTAAKFIYRFVKTMIPGNHVTNFRLTYSASGIPEFSGKFIDQDSYLDYCSKTHVIPGSTRLNFFDFDLEEFLEKEPHKQLRLTPKIREARIEAELAGSKPHLITFEAESKAPQAIRKLKDHIGLKLYENEYSIEGGQITMAAQASNAYFLFQSSSVSFRTFHPSSLIKAFIMDRARQEGFEYQEPLSEAA